MPRTSRVSGQLVDPYLIDVPHPRSKTWREDSLRPVPLVWHEVFGNGRQVEIEVGFGKGLFLLNSSAAHPFVNFLGVELERKYVLHTAARLAKRGVGNVRLACTDARWLLRERVAADSVQAIHVCFPDPWWKHRHQKRKLVTAEFTQQCARVLVLGGMLHFVSDVADYFAQTCALVAEQGLLRRVGELPDAHAEARLLTNFERKYRAEGRPIHRACFVK